MTCPRHWRLALALCAHRIEQRLGRHLTDCELDRLRLGGDRLRMREIWLLSGGRLEVRGGQLCLSETLDRRRKR